MNGSDFVFLLPEIVLVATAITVWTVDFFTPRDRKPDLAWPAAAGALVAMAFLAISWGEHREMFLGTLRLDNFSLFFRFLFLAVAFFVIVGSPGIFGGQQVSTKEGGIRGELGR